MGRCEFEKLTLLPLSSNSSNSTINPSSSSSSTDGDDNSDREVKFQQRKKHFRTKLAGAIRSTTSSTLAVNNRRKLHLNRGIGKRLTRFVLFAFMVPMLLFLTFYNLMFSGASSRHCKCSFLPLLIYMGSGELIYKSICKE